MNMRNIAQRTYADQTGREPLSERRVSPTTAARRRPPLRAKLFLLTTPAIATRETPMIRVVLAVTEPIAFPIAS